MCAISYILAPLSRRRSDAERTSEPRLASLARWLEDYISWIDDIDENADTRPACRNEVRKSLAQEVTYSLLEVVIGRGVRRNWLRGGCGKSQTYMYLHVKYMYLHV